MLCRRVSQSARGGRRGRKLRAAVAPSRFPAGNSLWGCRSRRRRVQTVDLSENRNLSVGRPLVGFFEGVGELSLLLGRSVAAVAAGRISVGEMFRQMSIIGVHSLPI